MSSEPRLPSRSSTPGHPQLGEQLGEQLDRLGVGERRVGADRLGAELVELAVAARLRALVAEERPEVGELHRLRQLLHAVLDVGAADRRRALGPQGEAAPALVLEGEHLLADDVGGVADAALEQLGVLEAGRGDRLVAGAGEDRRRGALDPPARAGRVGQDVEGPAGCLVLGPATVPRPYLRRVPAARLARPARRGTGCVARSAPRVVTPMWPG